MASFVHCYFWVLMVCLSDKDSGDGSDLDSARNDWLRRCFPPRELWKPWVVCSTPTPPVATLVIQQTACFPRQFQSKDSMSLLNSSCMLHCSSSVPLKDSWCCCLSCFCCVIVWKWLWPRELSVRCSEFLLGLQKRLGIKLELLCTKSQGSDFNSFEL